MTKIDEIRASIDGQSLLTGSEESIARREAYRAEFARVLKATSHAEHAHAAGLRVVAERAAKAARDESAAARGEVERLTRERDKYQADRRALLDAAQRLMCSDAPERRLELADAVNRALRPLEAKP